MPCSTERADLSADIEHEYISNFLKASEGFWLYEMTNRPREVCTRSVTKVEVAGHTQLRANMAYLNSSSHTTWSEKEQMIRDFRRSGRRFIKSYTDKVLNNLTFCKNGGRREGRNKGRKKWRKEGKKKGRKWERKEEGKREETKDWRKEETREWMNKGRKERRNEGRKGWRRERRQAERKPKQDGEEKYS